MPLPPPPSLQGRLLTLISLYGGQGSEVAASLEAEWAALSGGAVHCGGTEEGAAALSGGAVHCGGMEDEGAALSGGAVHCGGMEEGAAALPGGAVHCGGTEEGGVAVAEAVHRGGILTVGDLPAPLHAGSVGATRLGDEGGLVWEAAMTGYIQRQLQGSSWKLCSEFLAWPQCPLGSVPGQSRDPEAMVLTEFTLLEMADGDTGETRGESPSGWPCGGLSPCAPPPGPLWGVEELTLLKGSLQ
uniref:Uncharacterized protein LOC116957371 n=1 Tax=Petromyzon marinus TaxID=7757 RepID=A0AAJ7UGJ8_PETMA|nr:uncharacterized protein LOC116957371 [Petromyzon marinus]